MKNEKTDRINKKFIHILSPYLADGLFSEAYAACGYLTDDSPTFEYAHTEKSRTHYFDLASLTKVLATSPLVYKSTFLDKTDLTQRNKEVIHGNVKLDITSLLNHTSGLPPWLNFWIEHLPDHCAENRVDREKIIEKTLTRKKFNRGPENIYSDIGYIFLGYLLEYHKKKDLSEQFDDFTTNCLNINQLVRSLGFLKSLGQNVQSICSGFCKLRGKNLCGEVHDENCGALGSVSGHAGLFSTGLGLVNFISKFFITEFGASYFQAVKKSMAQNTENKYHLGWLDAKQSSCSAFGGKYSVGHFGFTGTSLFIDLDSGAYGVLLTNRTINRRLDNSITQLRASVYEFFQMICPPEQSLGSFTKDL